MRFWKNNFIIYGTAAVIFFADQLLKKYFTDEIFIPATSQNKLFISFWPVLNENLSFNIPLPNWMASILAIAIIILLILKKGLLPFNIAAWSLIISGAISNILDRIFYGGVVDYIHLSFWPTSYNLADLAIIAGVILAAINLFHNPAIAGNNINKI